MLILLNFNAGTVRSCPQTLPIKHILKYLPDHLPMTRISVATERNASDTTASTATLMFSCFAILRYTNGRIHSSSSPVKQNYTCKTVHIYTQKTVRGICSPNIPIFRSVVNQNGFFNDRINIWSSQIHNMWLQ